MNRAGVYAERALLAVTALIALCFFVWTLLIWYRYHPHLPWRDTVLLLSAVVPVVDTGVSLEGLLGWLEPHYGAHRIFLPRALVALDVAFFSGQNHLPMAAAWASLLLMAGVFWRFARRRFSGNLRIAILALSLAVLYLFSPSHVWNLANPVNTSWHLTVAFSILAFTVLLDKKDQPSWRQWLWAFLLAGLAALSTFGGVIAWLLLACLALLLRSPFILPVLLSSTILVVLYCQNLVSDASVGVNWTLGTPEVVAKIQQESHTALAANTPWMIALKATRFLTWPLTASHTWLAGILSAASVGLLILTWFRVIRRGLSGGERYSRWLELCLLAATLCAGIAVATQLGRILSHPNHIHGPSQERYQTVVVLYWFSVSGLILAASAAWPTWKRLPVHFACVLLALVLSAPLGDYLKEEIGSLEYAAALYLKGERAQLRDPVAGKLINFFPERVFRFDAFLTRRELAYRVPVAAPDAGPASEHCAPGRFHWWLEKTERPSVQSMTLSLQGSEAWTAREISLFHRQHLVGRLYPQHRGDYTPLALLAKQHNQWRGLLEPPAAGSGPLRVVVRTLFGPRPVCIISEDELIMMAATP